MGRLIEQQAVIDCLTNTAKYFDMPQADEWTKGIHYGLIHGLDNILDNVPTVDAIPIPKGATNGDVIRTLFPKAEYLDCEVCIDVVFARNQENWFDKEWWNAPYKENEDGGNNN